MGKNEELQSKLLLAAIDTGNERLFLPENRLGELVTKLSIEEELKNHCKNMNFSQMAENVFKKARRLFVILVVISAVEHLPAFIAERLSDEDLPFDKDLYPNGDWRFCKQSKTGQNNDELVIKAMEDWGIKKRLEFSRNQWLVKSPVFRAGQHYKLDYRQVLPFIQDGKPGSNEKLSMNTGGFGEVWAVKLHFAHERLFQSQTREKEEPLIAVKRLFLSSGKAFENEKNMLSELRKKKHRHLVKLLATFEQSGDYHLMFPYYAEGNLKQLWENSHPNPPYQRSIFIWYLEQMEGLADALYTIHEFKSSSGPERGEYLKVQDVENRYGRHGDIKPENILWEGPTKDGSFGALIISDFGLARFHRAVSRSEIPSTSIVGTPTYEPPEMAVAQAKINRRYDTWSIGCIYLEFVIWLLEGSEALKNFTKARQQRSYDNVIDEAFYFYNRETKEASPRQAVSDWISKMCSHPRCSRAIQDVLKFILTELLHPDSALGKRADSKRLKEVLGSIHSRGRQDEEYLFSPVQPQSIPDSISAYLSPWLDSGNGGAINSLGRSDLSLGVMDSKPYDGGTLSSRMQENAPEIRVTEAAGSEN